MKEALTLLGAVLTCLFVSRWALPRYRLSRAKHPSLGGHARWSQRFARLVPSYEFGEDEFFSSDGAPADVAALRRQGFEALARGFREKSPETLAASREIEAGASDLQFVNRYRVPFPFRNLVRKHLLTGSVAWTTRDRYIADLDGNWSLDVSGSYGVNLLGYDVYKGCIDRAVERARDLGPVLGTYHPVVAENIRRIRDLSGLDEASFHMSGTEAVMQAVRLARYHTGRSHAARFCGAYHGWWDGVQPGPGNPRPPHEVYTLRDMSPHTLKVLETRSDIACVLVNPLQALHPNSSAPSDGALASSQRPAGFDKSAYSAWLNELRAVCTRRGIVLIFDEVFLGFRLARGGAQEYFSVRADLVTYGKTLGGGLPVGVLCGRAEYMRRFKEESPADICFARGTFNSHPYVMTAMNEFLRLLDRPEILVTYAGLDELWNGRAASLNSVLAARSLPVRVANMCSVFTTVFTQPSRYAWMLQYYLRAHGISMSWVGTGRYIFSHDFTDADYDEFREKFVAAVEAMRAHGWWWSEARLTHGWIKKRILLEMVQARLFGARPPLGDGHSPATKRIQPRAIRSFGFHN